MSDTTARDQLAQICSLIMDGHYDDPDDDAYALAEEIISRGWRPPASVVTTVEELDALVAHTVVRYCTRYGWGTAEKAARDRWWPVGDAAYITNTQVLHYGPATVLWEPEEGE